MSTTWAPVPVMGVDGIRGGWVAALVTPTGDVHWRVGATLDPLLEAVAGQGSTVAVDIPIGLTDGPPRACDQAARRRLPGRASSVFSAPTTQCAQDWFAGETHAEAVRRAHGRGHPAPTRQTWNITDKILQTERTLQQRAEPPRVVECHPEVTFAEMAAQVLRPKRTAAGVAERMRTLAGRAHLADPIDVLTHAPAGVPIQDALDALACAWTAARVSRGAGVAYGDSQQRDRHGRPMLIWA